MHGSGYCGGTSGHGAGSAHLDHRCILPGAAGTHTQSNPRSTGHPHPSALAHHLSRYREWLRFCRPRNSKHLAGHRKVEGYYRHAGQARSDARERSPQACWRQEVRIVSWRGPRSGGTCDRPACGRVNPCDHDRGHGGELVRFAVETELAGGPVRLLLLGPFGCWELETVASPGPPMAPINRALKTCRVLREPTHLSTVSS